MADSSELRKRILPGFLVILAVAWLFFTPGAYAEFIPDQPTLSAEQLRSGMRGHMLTVLKGTTPVRLPVEIVSVIPQRGSARHLIMIRLLPSAENRVGLAQGMSGAPVYVDGKLVGAVSMGWSFSDHTAYAH
jgi:hypothetical protein